jgi:hypothetical protein
MRRTQGAAAVLALVLTGCATIVLSNYRPGERVSATVGYPLIDVQSQTTVSRPGMERLLIYGGMSGETIRLTYREMSADRHVAGSTQELQFDLSRSNRITFQEMRLEVIEATSEKITAIVLPASGEDSRGLALEPGSFPVTGNMGAWSGARER